MSQDSEQLMSDDDLLLAHLRAHRSRCPSCGYDLGGISVVRCPECGEPFSLSVVPGHERFGLLVLGLVGYASCFGASTMALVWMLSIAFTYGDGLSSWEWSDYLPLLGWVASSLVGMALWLVLWRRARRLIVPIRWLIAMIGWAMFIVFGTWWVMEF